LLLMVPAACDVPFELDEDQTPPVMVIEAQVTDVAHINYVKLSTTVSFYYQGDVPLVTDAVVTVAEEGGNIFTYSHNPGGSPDSVGYYLPDVPFSGKEGLTYTLSVTHDGAIYSASDVMAAPNKIDSLSYQVNPFMEFFDPEEEDKHELLLYAKEPQGIKNYYMFRFFKNDSVYRSYENDVYIAEDVALGEDINGLPSPVLYAQKDTAIVNILSVSRYAYVYYFDLQLALNNDGGMFSPPPANPNNNLDNDALGFFLVASVAADTVIIW